MTTAEQVIRRKCDPNADPNAIGPRQYSILIGGSRHYSPEFKCGWNALLVPIRAVSDILPDGCVLSVLSGIDGKWYDWPITKGGK